MSTDDETLPGRKGLARDAIQLRTAVAGEPLPPMHAHADNKEFCAARFVGLPHCDPACEHRDTCQAQDDQGRLKISTLVQRAGDPAVMHACVDEGDCVAYDTAMLIGGAELATQVMEARGSKPKTGIEVVTVRCAGSDRHTTKPIRLHIDEPMKPIDERDPYWQRKIEDVYREDAELIAEALRHHLPGGTYDQVLARMLKDRASLFRVPHFDTIETLRPHIVVLCGSTRFYDAYQRANAEETLKGHIVLTIGAVPESTAPRKPGQVGKRLIDDIAISPAQKVMLDELHKRKIDMADEVLVLNVGGYIGTSTAGEIEYAELRGKPIRWLEAPAELCKRCKFRLGFGPDCDFCLEHAVLTKRVCDHHSSHDSVTDVPTGPVCGAPATHRIVWLDGSRRFSLACGDHLAVDSDAPPHAIVALASQPSR
jgi:hypothetical protein